MSEEDRKIIRKLIALAEMHNFVLEAWISLIDEVKAESVRQFLYAFRSYASYLIDVGRDAELPRTVFENALKHMKESHPEMMKDIEPLLNILENLRKKCSSS